jgi:hypothetical protein
MRVRRALILAPLNGFIFLKSKVSTIEDQSIMNPKVKATSPPKLTTSSLEFESTCINPWIVIYTS